MGSLRNLRAGTVAGVIAWKLTALALLPAALCCQATLIAAESLPCCEGESHGAMCPMDKSPNRAAHASGGPETGQPGQARMIGCNSLDDALIGLVGLTGFTPDAFALAADPAVTGRVVPTHDAAASFAGAPHAPPPRA
ncbi:MAG: hypothetical protein F4Y45_09960 [Acidobacteria bacterium]|nr:hypothetical protein [Acidobacteriota bacterium]MYD71639.1 hypothetical protein [Acidobacteriota bacterium]MYJ04423.1 hypothetical protein [Acidobacteriota bacterium]